MLLYLIRHAQSINNANWGNPDAEHIVDTPLSPLGHQQAQHLAARLRQDADDAEAQAALDRDPATAVYRIDELYVSPMLRALQTAQPIGTALDQPLRVMRDLHESGGAYKRHADGTHEGFPGLTKAATLEQFPSVQFVDADLPDDGWWNRDPEPFTDFSSRAQRLVAYAKAQAQGDWQGKHIAWVMHADIIHMFLATLLIGPQTEDAYGQMRFGIYNTSTTRIDFEPTGRTLIRYVSRADHLPVAMMTR